MNYKHSCVIDAEGFYKTLVLVKIEPDEAGQIQEQVQCYALAAGETIIDAKAPSMRVYACAQGFVKPRWSGATWVEGATAAEIERWEQEHPAPEPPGPAAVDILGQQVAALSLSNLQKDQLINALGAQLAQTSLDVMNLKSNAGGGV